MNKALDFSGCYTVEDIEDVRFWLDRFTDLHHRLGSFIVVPGDEANGAFTLIDALRGLSCERLVDIDAAAVRLLRLLFLDASLTRESPLGGLSDEALLQRLGEVLRVSAQEGVRGVPTDSLDENAGFPADLAPGAGGITPDLITQEPGDEQPPCGGGLGGLVPVESDVRGLIHGAAPVTVGGAPPP